MWLPHPIFSKDGYSVCPPVRSAHLDTETISPCSLLSRGHRALTGMNFSGSKWKSRFPPLSVTKAIYKLIKLNEKYRMFGFAL